MMMTYIVVNEIVFPTDTDEQIEAAKQALRDCGVEKARVFAGDPSCADAQWAGIYLSASLGRVFR